MLWSVEPLMSVADGEPSLTRDNLALLDGQLPTLAAGSVGTVVRTAAADEELRIGGDVDVRLVGTLRYVVKWVRAEGAMGVDALGRRERECSVTIMYDVDRSMRLTDIGIFSAPREISG